MPKKKQSKKHKFKYAEPLAAGVSLPVADSPVPGQAIAQRASVMARARVASLSASNRDFSYVAPDLQRIAILACCLVALEFVMWFLFSHTGLGNVVYQIVQA